MGGCRCHFRNCHVNNTKFQRMHFFRFPLKDSKRYKKWRLYAKMEHMVDFSEVRRKNTSICARHFRTECFMNYRMDRLAPNAVPTLMRLSRDQALDYELDIENGILVRLEETKFTHLIPPNNFECPLHLENDNILLDKLTEIQYEQYSVPDDVPQNIKYEDSNTTVEYEEVIMENPVKPLVNSVQILETIQVTGPNAKRTREISDDEGQNAANANNKKCRILNITNCVGANEMQNRTGIVLAPESIQGNNCEIVNSDDIQFVEDDEIENIQDLVNNDEHLELADDFINSNDIEADDDDIDFVEIRKDENNLQYDLSPNDPDSTIVQLKRYRRRPSISEALSEQLEIAQKELSELKKKSQDFNLLQVKLSKLETENAKLNETFKENEQIKMRLVSLQKENNSVRKTLNENKNICDKLQQENKKLKEETANLESIKAELISREQETKKLKKLLETFKGYKSKEEVLKQQFDLELENERSNNLASELKLKEEITALKRKLELTQQQLGVTENELKDVQTDLNSMKNERDRLTERHEELEQSLNHIQNNFDTKQNDYKILKTEHDNVQQKFIALEQKYWKLQALQNQEATVTTSLENTNKKPTSAAISTPSISANSLTKAQLFNGIKRYLSASMVSLLRMEMFGSSEREWKSDERQVAMDILRLGETVYKYFTDEWRFRLPGLRDVRNWLSQSQQMMEDEEDL